MITSKLRVIDNGLSVTSRGVFKFRRIDEITAPFEYNDEYFQPVVTNDADEAVMWFLNTTPFREADGSKYWPTKLVVCSDILDIHIELDRNVVQQIWEKYVFEHRLCLHSILSIIDSEWELQQRA